MIETTRTGVPLELGAYRQAFREWLAGHAAEYGTALDASEDEVFSRGLTLSNSMWRAGWKQMGWARAVGGLGGGPRHRATYYDELCRAGIEVPDTDLSIEVIGPALLHYSPALAEQYLPALLAGEESWAQAFSEPDAGSDLAGLRTRGIVATGGDLVVSGQKVWTSHGHLAQRLLVLIRTGTAESRHRGLSAVLVDAEDPRIVRRPLTFANGKKELSEIFFDDVHVSQGRLVGPVDGGWKVAMHMLQYERGMYAAQRQAWLTLRLRQLIEHFNVVGAQPGAGAAIARAWLRLQVVRARAIQTVRRLDAGDEVGPDSSADKLLLSSAERAVFDAARFAEDSAFTFDASDAPWRDGWWYSRASSIFGGSAEIQRTLIADRVLGLPRSDR